MSVKVKNKSLCSDLFGRKDFKVMKFIKSENYISHKNQVFFRSLKNQKLSESLRN